MDKTIAALMFEGATSGTRYELKDRDGHVLLAVGDLNGTPKSFFEDDPQQVTHAEMVTALVKPGADIRASMTPEMADMLHAAVGISGEAGELLDGVKKHVIYNKPLDRENIIEELGDLEFYMEQLRQRIGVTRDETLAANIAKLSVRYEGLRYSDAAAQNRADKS